MTNVISEKAEVASLFEGEGREGRDDVRFYKNGSDTLVIWFGGINEPFLSGALANEGGYDLLALMDQRFDWYTNGVLPTHTLWEQGVAFLSKAIAEGGYRKTVFCGQSSGGYGALFYAFHCRAALCIAFSPQTGNFFNGQCHMVPHVPLHDLRALYGQGSDTVIVLNASRDESGHEDSFFWDDWRHIRRLENYPNATIINHPYDNHSVSVRLRQDNLLYKLVTGLIAVYA
jgi:hypothetical protein